MTARPEEFVGRCGAAVSEMVDGKPMLRLEFLVALDEMPKAARPIVDWMCQRTLLTVTVKPHVE